MNAKIRPEISSLDPVLENKSALKTESVGPDLRLLLCLAANKAVRDDN